MKLIPLYGHGWESNCYLLIDRSEALLVDAGVSANDIMATLEKEGASLKYIVLTHGHFDHTFSVDTLRDQTGSHLLIHEDDAEMLTDSEKSALYYFSGERTSYRPADRLLRDGDSILLGDSHLRVLHTPGHSRGSICLLTDGILFSGDTLFDGGYGRYDLYGGDAKILAASLRSLRNLDPNLIIHPGHGGPSSLGRALDLVGNFIL